MTFMEHYDLVTKSCLVRVVVEGVDDVLRRLAVGTRSARADPGAQRGHRRCAVPPRRLLERRDLDAETLVGLI